MTERQNTPHTFKRFGRCAYVILTAVLLISAQAQAKHYTYVAGNNNTSDVRGPTSDQIYIQPRVMGKTVAYHQENALRELIVYDWNSEDTSAGGGEVYCNATESTDTPFVLEPGYGPPTGKTPDGHDMWKTDVPGLYFAVEFRTLYMSNTNLSMAAPFWLGGDKIVMTTIPVSSLKGACDNNMFNTYSKVGGIGFGTYIHLYADATFKPSTTSPTTDVNFPNTKGFDFAFYNEMTELPNGRHKIKFSYNTQGFNAVWPTCTASTISGDKVKNSTLNFGSYYPKQIMEGLNAETFKINLSNCSYIKNIEVKLTSTATGADQSLLTNTLTGGTAASGIGVEIQGMQTNLSNQMVLLPNNTSSVYKYSPYASQDAYIDSANTYTANTLTFLATLKHDSNATITPGSFKATGTFQMTYP
ncbi:fimbrial protein [Citrobacter freundii]|uniref:fimbrial protein n=1 Tax=Citrobacter freundii TaxID=546 RepID=UPI00177EDEA5|nr:fimbrial protein [Citrobacter freundii]MBD9990449.1 hypothetical protein [Citrobacter freundii]MBE0052580.1 hypothetical protein [Citrobacter freundii]MDT7291840.1 fimbrial protein [Citrobacter freundii]HBU6166525.1 fimbrial protein [Citrobacter freundii]HBV8018228.1 fimbrial protein [Citrobacter freundii]